MSYDFIEGFDYYPDDVATPGVGLNSTWIVTGFGGYSSLVAGRFEGKAARYAFNAIGGYAQRVVPGSTKKVLGFALKMQFVGNNPEANGASFFKLQDQYERQLLKLTCNNVGELRVFGLSPTVPLGISTRVVLQNTWHYVEFEFNLADAGRFKLYIDGQEQFTYNGDLKQFDDSVVSRVRLDVSGVSAFVVDDMYCLSDVDDVLGESRIQLLEAISDRSVQFDPSVGVNNFSNIDDSSTDGDATYNSTNTPGNRDVFNFSQITVEPTLIHAVGTVLASRKEDSGTRTIKSVLQSGASEASGNPNNQTTDYIWTRDITPLDPNGAVPWLKTSVNALGIGYELVL